VIRNGVGLDVAASVELAGVRRVWALSGGGASTRYLVLSFAAATRVLALEASGELDERSVAAFDAASCATLCCADVPANHIAHVTAAAVTLVPWLLLLLFSDCCCNHRCCVL
jgi:hypothetical protein